MPTLAAATACRLLGCVRMVEQAEQYPARVVSSGVRLSHERSPRQFFRTLLLRVTGFQM